MRPVAPFGALVARVSLGRQPRRMLLLWLLICLMPACQAAQAPSGASDGDAISVPLTTTPIIQTFTAKPAPAASSAPKPPTPVLSPAPSASPFALHATTVRLVQRIDREHGWALSGQHLLWTEDAGTHWRSITPLLGRDQAIDQGFFRDAAHGWLIVSGPNDATRHIAHFSVLHTTNSGATWQSSPLITYTDCFNCVYRAAPSNPPDAVDHLLFIDEQEGWAAIDRTETMSSYQADLFHTTDRGQTWQRLSALPSSGEIVFHTAQRGWLRGECCTGAVQQLWQTDDGGATWQPVQIPGVASYGAITLPVFLSQTFGLLPISIADQAGQFVGQIAVYATADGGQTWQERAHFIPPLTQPLDFTAQGVVFQPLDGHTWFVGLNDQLYQTFDAGQSWQRISTTAQAASFSQLLFMDASQGWAIALKNNCGGDCALLLRTSDGSQHWEALTVAASQP